MLNINENTDNGKTIIALAGRLDTITAPGFEEKLQNIINGKHELIMDFANLEYISSAGLRLLLSAQKRMSKQGKMKLVNVNDTVMEILEVTGFADILTIE